MDWLTSPFTPRHTRRRGLCVLASIISLLIASWTASSAFAAPHATSASSGVRQSSSSGGKARGYVPDPAWVAAKLAYRVHRTSSGVRTAIVTPMTALSAPSAYILSNSLTQTIWEPKGNESGDVCTRDATGRCYIDHYMWGLCGPGAATVALYYWSRPVFSYDVSGNPLPFDDPHSTTYWDDVHGRAYMMYMALQSNPPIYATPGLKTYGTYPVDVAYNGDMVPALNWEASLHNRSGYTNFFYYLLMYNDPNLNATSFHNDIVQDISFDQVPPIVDLNAQTGLTINTSIANRGDWINVGTTTSHFVAIIGYDDVAHTYTYIDTCGAGCNNSGRANGVYTASQSAVWFAVQNDFPGELGSGALIW